MSEWRILTGDWIEMLKTLPDESVHCVVTSPPYFGLRDYGVAGQVGLESSLDEYIGRLVEGFREVRRVLRSDGVLWCNMGDSYNANGRETHGTRIGEKQGTNRASAAGMDSCRPTVESLKPKDLLGVPWMLAFALRADGWYLRQDIIWAKPNPMPESVTDRCTKGHEYLFLLTKSANYYCDMEAIKEPASYEVIAQGALGKCGNGDRNDAPEEAVSHTQFNPMATRNRRSVWTITTEAFPEAHFATFPKRLVEPCIMAGTSEKGCCSVCGKPWERITETQTFNRRDYGSVDEHVDLNNGRAGNVETRTLGWQPACTCNAGDPVPCTVLDPFSGAGTTGLVATRLGRNFVGIELNPQYVEMSERRIQQDAPLFNCAEASQ